MDRNNIFAILEAALAVVVWGAAFIARKIALREVQPLTVIWLRFGMGVIVLGIAVALRKQFVLFESIPFAFPTHIIFRALSGIALDASLRRFAVK